MKFTDLLQYIKFRNNRTVVNGAMFAIFSFINRGFGFFLLLLLANYIAPAEYGYLSLFNTVVMIIGFFMALSTEGYMSVAYFGEGPEGVKKTFSGILFLTITVSLFLVISILLGGEWLSEKLSLSRIMLYIAVAIAFFTVFVNLNLDFFRIKGKVKQYGLFSCGNALLNFTLTLILVIGLLLSWFGRVYAQLLCFSLFGIIAIVFFCANKLYCRLDFTYLKKMLLWGIPLIPHQASAFFRDGCDKYIINHFHTIEEVGLFSFAATLGTVIFMFGVGFNQSYSVDIYKILGDNDLSNVEKKAALKKQRMLFTKIYVVFAALFTITCYFIIPLLLPKYSGAMNYFLLLSVYYLLTCIYLVHVNALFYYKKTNYIMYITLFSSLLHMVLSLFFTRYSLYYTCLFYILTQSTVVVVIAILSNKYIKQNIFLHENN